MIDYIANLTKEYYSCCFIYAMRKMNVCCFTEVHVSVLEPRTRAGQIVSAGNSKTYRISGNNSTVVLSIHATKLRRDRRRTHEPKTTRRSKEPAEGDDYPTEGSPERQRILRQRLSPKVHFLQIASPSVSYRQGRFTSQEIQLKPTEILFDRQVLRFTSCELSSRQIHESGNPVEADGDTV